MDQSLITRIVEAALLAASQPLTLAQLNALFPEDQPAPAGSVAQAIEALQAACAERGIRAGDLGERRLAQVDDAGRPAPTLGRGVVVGVVEPQTVGHAVGERGAGEHHG